MKEAKKIFNAIFSEEECKALNAVLGASNLGRETEGKEVNSLAARDSKVNFGNRVVIRRNGVILNTAVRISKSS